MLSNRIRYEIEPFSGQLMVQVRCRYNGWPSDFWIWTSELRAMRRHGYYPRLFNMVPVK